MSKKWIYLFSEGNATMRDLLGGKGASAAEMVRANLPVPPGFTITTEACNAYRNGEGCFPDGLWDQTLAALAHLEKQVGKKLGYPGDPLLVSVRSGAQCSMPGMMDTVLNMGINKQSVDGLAERTSNERFAYDTYRRFLQMFGKIVLEINGDKFEHLLDDMKKEVGAVLDTDLTSENLRTLVQRFETLARDETGSAFPDNPLDQLRMSIEAVFRSWNNLRAINYRDFHKIPHDLGTAVNIQTMVYGNMGRNSGSGVAFTRNPNTGERKLFGEYLPNAQGEDVVAGIRTPQSIEVMSRELPSVYDQFENAAQQLEKHYRDMQDLEFTVENGCLYMLQTRTGKRSAPAAVQIAVDMVDEGLISKEEAVSRVEPNQVEQLLHRRIDPSARTEVIATGLNASPGAATGKAVFDANTASELTANDDQVILVRPETNPDDVHGMIAAHGILTARGGATSHAAVVARSIGRPCVTACAGIKVDVESRQFSVNGRHIKEGDLISINGSTGEVIAGEVPLIDPEITLELGKLLGWADNIRRLQVWANADYPRDARIAREYGAQGIGLCRTEHMFFETERIPIVRNMILAEEDAEREKALAQLLNFQREDFRSIFREMDGLPVVIRLLDPPLHEFLPPYEQLLVEVSELRHRVDCSPRLEEMENLLSRVAGMREENPMLGLRGCRLGLVVPGVNAMQVRAILMASADVQREGKKVLPEIMVPLVSHVNELRAVREDLKKTAEQVEQDTGLSLPYKLGAMIEVPRAALTAEEIAQYADFFSFGTNDLTQTTFAISRDDAESKFLLHYVKNGILPNNPFQVLDQSGIGQLMRIAVECGRRARPDIELGICGEHGGEPSSIAFCHNLGLDYVSCSPYRTPVARLAAAQAALTTHENEL